MALTGLAFAAAKVIATRRYVPRDATVFDVSFGFGDYVRSLSEHGRFEWVLGDRSLYAARMPLLPLTYAGLGRLSRSLITAGLLKNFLLSTFTASSFAYLLEECSPGDRADAAWVCVCLPLSLSPPVIKHASAVDYEEGFLLEILFVWCTAFLWMTRALGSGRVPSSGSSVPALSVASSSAALMLKTSMTTVFSLTEVVALSYALRFRSPRTFLAVWLGALPPLLWGLRNRRVTGHFAVRTSWDGENLYRGFSSEALELYPDVCLDRMFDSPRAFKADGTVVEITPKAAQGDFGDEWEWDRHYRDLSVSWLRAHPGDAAWFTLRKARNFFVSIRTSPYTYGVDARGDGGRRGPESTITSAWLLVGRGLQLVAVALAWRLWASGRRDRRAVALGVVGVNGAYALPYLAGFNYERHVTVYLVLVGSCVAVMAGELA